MDSDAHSKADITSTCDKGVSDAEKETAGSGSDVEKQTQGQGASQENASPLETEEIDPNIVEFDEPGDPGNPKNWTARRRSIITLSMGLMTFVVTFSSSIFAIAIEPVAAEFDVGISVATLGVSFFLLVSKGEDMKRHRVAQFC